MTLPQGSEPNNRRRLLSIALVVILIQVGCLTLAIILGALFGGLWLDNRFQTRPVITLVLLVASIPISLVIMFAVVRKGLARIKPQLNEFKEDQK